MLAARAPMARESELVAAGETIGPTLLRLLTPSTTPSARSPSPALCAWEESADGRAP